MRDAEERVHREKALLDKYAKGVHGEKPNKKIGEASNDYRQQRDDSWESGMKD